jgi:hypothetical protein
MRVELTIALLLMSPACAARKAPAPAAEPIKQFLFSEQLVDETRVCVPQSPWNQTPACMSLGALRHQLRHVRYAGRP